MAIQQMFLGIPAPSGGNQTFVTDGLVTNLDAGEASTWNGSILQDQVGSSDCTFSGGGYSYTTDYGGGIRFNHTNLNDSNWDGGLFATPNIEQTQQTWELWTNMTHGNNLSGVYTYLVHNNSVSTSTGASHMTIGVNASNNYYAAMDGTYSSMDSGVSGAWYNSNGNSSNYHIVLVWDGTWEKMYVNGSMVVQHEVGPVIPQNFDSNTAIGANSFTTSNFNYREAAGTFYSLRIYAKALTTAEVQSNFNGNKAKFGL